MIKMINVFSAVSSAWSFIKDIDIRIILGIAILFLAGFAYHQYEKKQQYQQQVEKQKNNIKALQDSTRKYKTISGVIGAERLALQMTHNQLKETNKELYNELQQERDNVEVITVTETVVESDTAETETELSKLHNERFKID